MALVLRPPYNSIPASPECLASAVIQHRTGAFLVTSALRLAYRSLTEADRIPHLERAPIRSTGTDYRQVAEVVRIEDLLSPNRLARTGAVLARMPDPELLPDVPRSPVYAIPWNGVPVTIGGREGSISGHVVTAGGADVPPIIPNGQRIRDTFIVRLASPDAALSTDADSGAPVIAGNGTWLGMFLYRPPGEALAYCSSSLNIWRILGP